MRRYDRNADTGIGETGAQAVDAGNHSVDDRPVAFTEECDFRRMYGCARQQDVSLCTFREA
jgi:hypothetical protein